MNWLIPIPGPYLTSLEQSDRRYLILVSLVGILALGSILFLRWSRRPMSAIYWVVASLPIIVGTLAGLYQYDWVVFIAGAHGISSPDFWPEQMKEEGILTIHYGVLLSAILYTLNLIFHAWDVMAHRG